MMFYLRWDLETRTYLLQPGYRLSLEVWDRRTLRLAPVSLASLPDHMPKMITWPTKPEAAAGDIFVFEWGYYNYLNPETQEPARSKFPAYYIELTAHPLRHWKGHWQAPFRMIGWDRTEFMAPGGGTTTDPIRAIDDIPIEAVEKPISQDEAEVKVRKSKRDEEERLEKEAEHRAAAGPGTKARLSTEISRLDDAA